MHCPNPRGQFFSFAVVVFLLFLRHCPSVAVNEVRDVPLGRPIIALCTRRRRMQIVLHRQKSRRDPSSRSGMKSRACTIIALNIRRSRKIIKIPRPPYKRVSLKLHQGIRRKKKRTLCAVLINERLRP